MSILFAFGKPLLALLAGLAAFTLPDARMRAVDAQDVAAQRMAELEALEQRIEQAEIQPQLEVIPIPEEAPAEEAPAGDNP